MLCVSVYRMTDGISIGQSLYPRASLRRQPPWVAASAQNNALADFAVGQGV